MTRGQKVVPVEHGGQPVVISDRGIPVVMDGSSGGGAVDSVNGQTGTVVLTGSDIKSNVAGMGLMIDYWIGLMNMSITSMQQTDRDLEIRIDNLGVGPEYYVDGPITGSTLTTANRTIVTNTFALQTNIKPRGISGRFIINRDGGGTNTVGTLYLSIFVNGSQLGEEAQFTVYHDNQTTITADNIKQYTFSAGDLLEINTRYVGSGSATLSAGVYSIIGQNT